MVYAVRSYGPRHKIRIDTPPQGPAGVFRQYGNTMIRTLSPALLLLLGFLGSSSVVAHDSRPLFINITESGEHTVIVTWKTPPSVDPNNAPDITLAGCIGSGGNPGQRLAGSQIYSCETGLSENSLHIDYPLFNPSISSLVRIELNNGEVHSIILDPGRIEWRIPAPETFASVIKDYFALGVEHIFGGIDHLLFLAGLLYIARTLRRILITVTGFTLAHSITLFLVALDVIRVSVPAVETVIALSIVMLACEIARNDRTTLTWRRPLLVACGFGLVHGAGFAAALTETGLPQTEKISALLFFNLGVEAGQLLIIALVFTGLWSVSLLNRSVALAYENRQLRLVFSYALGIVSAFWFVERFTMAFV